jgi:hypothetical protein
MTALNDAERTAGFRAAADDSLPTVSGGQAPFLGRLLRLGGSTVQMVVVDHLLPPELLTGLIAAAGVTGP